MTDERWFSYDNGGNGFEIHESQEAAKKSAQDAMDYYQGNADDGWDESSDSVCWGRVYQEVAVVDSRPRTESDFVASWITHIEDRVLVDAGEAEAIEALRRRVVELEGERDRWKSSHHEMVDRNKLLRDRPDLPIERLQAYKQITAENADLKRQVEALQKDAEVGRLVKKVMPLGFSVGYCDGAPLLRRYNHFGYIIDRLSGGSLLEALREAAKTGG